MCARQVYTLTELDWVYSVHSNSHPVPSNLHSRTAQFCEVEVPWNLTFVLVSVFKTELLHAVFQGLRQGPRTDIPSGGIFRAWIYVWFFLICSEHWWRMETVVQSLTAWFGLLNGEESNHFLKSSKTPLVKAVSVASAILKKWIVTIL